MIWIVFALMYFVPTLVAAMRRTTNRNSVAVVNLFLGWTFIGWVAALAMSGSGHIDPPAPKTVRTLRPWVTNTFKPPTLVIDRPTQPQTRAGMTALKEEVFQLESDRLQSKISPQDYQTAKAALDKMLQRAIQQPAKGINHES